MAGVMSCACQNNSKSVDLNGKWSIAEVAGEVVSPEIEFIEAPYVIFDEDGRYSICAGANMISGEYTVEGDVVTLSEGAMTRMMAPPAVMEIEAKIVSAIVNPLTVSLQDGSLILSSESSVVFKLVK